MAVIIKDINVKGLVHLFSQNDSGPPPSGLGGSMMFDGINSYVTVPADADWGIGTDDYTVEWFQYQTSNPGFTRIFSLGAYPTADFAISIEESEGAAIYVWHNGNLVGSNVISDYMNVWTHFAVVRIDGAVTIYQNGVTIATFEASDDIANSGEPLAIGVEIGEAQDQTFFAGYMTNFRWTKGQGMYNTDFTPPTAPMSFGANTKLLLLANDVPGVVADATGNHTPTHDAIAWSPQSPF